MPHTKLSRKISEDLKDLEKLLPDKTRADLCVPYGTIRKVCALMPEYDFVKNNTMRRNICYAVEALDFYRWIINRFKLYGPVSGYLYKTGIILVDMITESMVRDFLKQKREKANKSHSKNIKKLSRLGVPQILCDRIDTLHSRRSNIHLHLVTDLEATKYTLKDWNRSILCLQATKEKFRGLLS